MRDLIIFDFDGTLVDTITDVGLCFNEALRRCGFPQHPLEAFVRFVGGDLETVVSRMLSPERRTPEAIDAVKTVYRKLYLSSGKPNTKQYPGIPKLLYDLKACGYKLAVNSNKGQLLLDDMVERVFPKDTFDAVVGYVEGKPSKPDPYGIDWICEQCDRTRENTIYVGDGKSDIDTAFNAGIPCIFVTWGQGSEHDAEDNRVTSHASDALQLAECVYKLSKTEG